jgi:hypothetical protein
VASAIAAEALKRGQAVTIIRNGSRGMFYLEPLVEVATDKGRVAFGSVTAADVPRVLAHATAQLGMMFPPAPAKKEVREEGGSVPLGGTPAAL